MKLQRVLIVDDDEAIRPAIAESLAKSGRDIRVAEHAAAALKALNDWRPDVVLSDVRMPGIDGLELLSLLSERVPTADVIRQPNGAERSSGNKEEQRCPLRTKPWSAASTRR